MTYKPYKQPPIGKRCPHGYAETECVTCVNAEEASRRKPIKKTGEVLNGWHLRMVYFEEGEPVIHTEYIINESKG